MRENAPRSSKFHKKAGDLSPEFLTAAIIPISCLAFAPSPAANVFVSAAEFFQSPPVFLPQNPSASPQSYPTAAAARETGSTPAGASPGTSPARHSGDAPASRKLKSYSRSARRGRPTAQKSPQYPSRARPTPPCVAQADLLFPG